MGLDTKEATSQRHVFMTVEMKLAIKLHQEEVSHFCLLLSGGIRAVSKGH